MREFPVLSPRFCQTFRFGKIPKLVFPLLIVSALLLVFHLYFEGFEFLLFLLSHSALIQVPFSSEDTWFCNC